jgi:hypothetical protein
MLQGYLQKNGSGKYSICEAYELNCGEGVEIKTPKGWMMMRVEHDGTDYYLLGDQGLSFYPKRVCARKRQA